MSNIFLDTASILAIIGAIAAGVVAVRKLGPEKGVLFITQAQGAAVIADNLIETLRREVDREREHNAWLRIEVDRLSAENERLEAANLTLARIHGGRHTDRRRPDAAQ